MKNMVFVRAFAKINIGLSVKGKSGGMHIIDTLVKKIELADEVFLKARTDGEFTVSYKQGFSFERDNAIVAAKAFREAYGTMGADIIIDKKIPIGSGLGGSSADMVGVIKGLEELYETCPASREILSSLGSDVLCMYLDGDYRVRGIGELCERVLLPRFNILLLCPENGVDTGKAYRDFDSLGGDECDIDEILKALSDREKDFGVKNALERAAVFQNPEITEAKSLLKSLGLTDVFMTGSGSAVVGLVDEKFKESAKSAVEGKGFTVILTE